MKENHTIVLEVSNRNRKDWTTYFDFLTDQNRMKLSLVRKPSLQGNLKHKSMRLSSQENSPKR